MLRLNHLQSRSESMMELRYLFSRKRKTVFAHTGFAGLLLPIAFLAGVLTLTLMVV